MRSEHLQNQDKNENSLSPESLVLSPDWADARFDTRAIHAGQDPDPATGAVITPIYQTSTYVQEGVGVHKGFEYSRTDNPTRSALQTALASLEAGTWALSYASGLAATQNLCYLLRPGDHVLLSDDAYGGTYRLIAKVVSPYGIDFSLVDMTDLDAVRAALRANTKMVFVETPTNPYLKVVDIAGIASVVAGTEARLVVDNTFASPALQQPLALGADFVLHSTTKYLGGHSDVVGGALVTADAALGEELAYSQNALGGVPGAFDSWLVLRGVKTLGVRMDRHCENAARIVDLLSARGKVAQVLYPGLPDHPGHEVADKQMKAPGGMVSFRLTGGEAAALEVCRRTRVFTLAESLGGVESLIEHPARMTHASVAGSALEVPADLVRLSVGIETGDDLLADLQQALVHV